MCVLEWTSVSGAQRITASSFAKDTIYTAAKAWNVNLLGVWFSFRRNSCKIRLFGGKSTDADDVKKNDCLKNFAGSVDERDTHDAPDTWNC